MGRSHDGAAVESSATGLRTGGSSAAARRGVPVDFTLQVLHFLRMLQPTAARRRGPRLPPPPLTLRTVTRGGEVRSVWPGARPPPRGR